MTSSTCITCDLDLTILSWAVVTLFATVVFHASALILLAKVTFTDTIVTLRHRSAIFSVTVFSALCVTVLLINALEIWGWSLLYYIHGASDNPIRALSHSMGAFTTYGSPGYFPDETWRLVSHLEAMNGLVAFGITTAFLYSASGRLHEMAK
jgi:hypothetical protein